MADRVFGEISGIAVGTQFPDRRAVHDSGIHAPLIAGISGSQSEGADSIVVSGGYEDDEDYGDVIIYTGHGGRDTNSGLQVDHQVLEAQNLALARSCDQGLPVRVVRGAGGDPTWSPATGYRYEGLFYVDRYWQQTGRSGFRVWRYRLIEGTQPTPIQTPPVGGPPARVATTVQRLVRSTEIGQRVKAMHGHVCQICGEAIHTPSGPYAEAAHIRPLGRPHDGPDVIGNVLCLCPNDHVRLDRGAVVITDDLEVLDTDSGAVVGSVRTIKGHIIDSAHVAYHRSMFGM